jgi:hypothetical protein
MSFYKFGIWATLWIAILTCGACGGGSSSGSSNENTQTVTQLGDFSLTLDKSTVSITAGQITPAVALQVTPTKDFSGAVTVSTQLPPGFNCFQNSCSGTLSGASSSLHLRFASSPLLSAGTYNLIIVASSGVLSHQIALSVQVTSFAPTKPNRSALVLSGDFFQFDPVFDRVHQLVYAPDMQGNVVHVISTRTHQLTRDISVPSPAGLDISADGKLLYAGSNTQYLYVIDTAKLAVVDRVRLPNSPIFSTIFPIQVAALSSGKVLLAVGCGRVNPCTSQVGLELYDRSAGSFSSVSLGAIASVGVMSRSADHSSVYIGSSDNGGHVARYDAATDALVPGQVTFGEFVNALAVSPDNSTLVAVLDCCELDLLDTNFNVKLKMGMNEFLSNPVFSSDSSRIYMATGAGGQQIQVFSSQDFSLLGGIPSLLLRGTNNPTLEGWDDDQHLIGYGPYAIVFIDASMPPTALPTQVPIYRFGILNNSAFTPDNPARGLSTTLNGAQFTETPLITFAGVPATDVALTTTNTINLNAPALSGVHDVDVLASFPSGYFLLAPSAYSYAPGVSFTDGDASAETDSGKLTVYGYGLNFPASQLSVTVAGLPATDVQVHGAASSWFPAPLYSVSAKVPPGVAGPADITVTTPIGSTSLPASFQYVHRDDYPLGSGASPFQMVYDKAGSRLFWTDPAAGTVEVFSLTSRSFVGHVSTGVAPAGLSLTPDGSKLLVAVFGERQMAIVDTATLKVTSKVATPFDPLLASIDPRPIFVVATANGKAFLLNTVDGYSCLNIYEYDLATNAFSVRNDTGVCPVTQAAVAGVSADGSRAILGTAIYNAANDTFTSLTSGVDSSPRALNADGSVIVTFRAFHAPDGARNGVAIPADQIESEVDFNWISGEKLNSTGSLLYFPEKDRIRIFDVRHGTLSRTLMVPDGLLDGGDCLSVEPEGRGLWVMTSRGLSHFTFVSDPLSVGEVQKNAGQLTVLGSGFDSRSQLLIDGAGVNTTFVDANHLVASINGIGSGPHQLTVQSASGNTYTLDAAFTSE